MRTALLIATLAALLVVATGSASAPAATCAYSSVYPGDDAAKETLAAWMAGGAVDAGLPGELPVMAALVESGMRNLNLPDADSAGYFQMPKRIWDTGDYAGFPDHPALQLQWFIDQAQAVRQQRIAAGNTSFGTDPNTFGDWVADVERPAAQYRYRYGLQLDQARSLIAAGCPPLPAPGTPTAPVPADPGSTPAAPDAQAIPDSVLPALSVVARRYQDAVRRRQLVVDAVCANDRCLLRANAAFAVARRGIFRLAVAPVQVGRGRHLKLRLTLGPRARAALTKALAAGTCPLAAIRVVAANAGGYRISQSRTVLLGTRRDCS